MNAVVMFPKGFRCGEDEWYRIMDEFQATGKMVKPNRVKEMFPEQWGVDGKLVDARAK